MKLRRAWQHRWVGRLGSLFLRALGSTWRVRLVIPGEPEPGVYLFLHGNLLMPAFLHRDDERHVTMISTHRDGELIAQVAERLGYRVVRGSKTRGGARAVLEVVKRHSANFLGVTPDGPRGPRGKVEPGLIHLAAQIGWKVYPVAYAASRAVRFDSWDRFTVPYPFARVVGVCGEPIVVPANPERQTCEQLAAEASIRLLALQEAAEAELATW